MIGLKRDTVEILNYQKDWAIIYEETKSAIEKVLVEFNIAIEHIGSTAIENMTAKPIIDVVIGLEYLNKATIEKTISKLENIHFIYRSNEGENGGYLFIKEKNKNVVSHHIHVVEQNDKQWNNYIHFRDALRKHSELALEYKQVKQSLAKKYPLDRLKYTNGKNEFIQAILQKNL